MRNDDEGLTKIDTSRLEARAADATPLVTHQVQRTLKDEINTFTEYQYNMVYLKKIVWIDFF